MGEADLEGALGPRQPLRDHSSLVSTPGGQLNPGTCLSSH